MADVPKNANPEPEQEFNAWVEEIRRILYDRDRQSLRQRIEDGFDEEWLREQFEQGYSANLVAFLLDRT